MFKNREYVEEIKRKYPPGTRIVLDQMGDDPHPIAPGTKGQVVTVDDVGTVHCNFSDGRRLGLIIGEDTFHIDKDIEKDPLPIILHIKYKEPIEINGFVATRDSITFDSKEELNKYIKGEPAYNILDDAVRKTDNEILLYADNEKGEVIWGTKIEERNISRPLQYYEPNLGLSGTADELFIQARNGYIDSVEALGKLQEILSNPVENKADKAFYVGVLKEIAETTGKDGQIYAQMKKDILDGVNPEEVTLREGLTLEVFKDRDEVVISLQEITDEAFSMGGLTLPASEFLAMNAKEISTVVNEAYFYTMVEETRQPEVDKPTEKSQESASVKEWKPKTETEEKQQKDDVDIGR